MTADLKGVFESKENSFSAYKPENFKEKHQTWRNKQNNNRDRQNQYKSLRKNTKGYNAWKGNSCKPNTDYNISEKAKADYSAESSQLNLSQSNTGANVRQGN
ncbi:hypothetical protein CHS0354_030286 [Potamilus streckersoni]|uniref:Uncharacterized protein n=1 Tax=Potamilus streckersoni TaxID=2493646 RepID=A0AAE0VJQ4_9BIVA|nr:hypothetical protein CHS0354_030286 [Potamilus streckersoni]